MIRFLKSFFNKRSADNRINSPRSSFEAKLSLLTAKQKQLQSQIESWEEEEALYGGSSIWSASERQHKYDYHGEMRENLREVELKINQVKQVRANTAFNAMQRLHQQTYQSLMTRTPINIDIIESIEKMVGSKPSI